MPAEQILLFAIFIGFALVQALIRRWQSKQRAEVEAEAAPEIEQPAEPERVWHPAPEAPPPVFPEPPPPRPFVDVPAAPVPPPFALPIPDAAPVPVRPPPPQSARSAAAVEARRRAWKPPTAQQVWSPNRSVVPRDRAGLQRAVALMVVLGPPRALEPPK